MKHLLTKLLSKKSYTKYLKQKIKLQKDEVALLCPHNSGEIYLICSMLDAFKKQNHVDKVVMIGSKKYHQQIYEMFAHKIERYHFIETKNTDRLKYHLSVKKGTFFLPTNSIWCNLIDYGIPHFDVIKICTHLPRDAELSPPSILEKHRVSAENKFKKLSLTKNKTVLISPEAISAISLPKSFWQKICEELKAKGYDVFLNIMDEKNALKDVKTEHLNFSEAFVFAQMCGHVLALRSGFCEVISGTNANFHIIYNGLSQNTYGMKQIIKKNLTEYIFENQSLDDLMNNILESF